MKKPEVYLKEYFQKISDEDLKYIHTRLDQRIGSDVAEVCEFFSESKEIDKWMLSAETSDQLYDMLDLVHTSASKEYEKRSGAEAFAMQR